MPILPAHGNYARALCDRCGFKKYWAELITERPQESTIKVCAECYDPIPDNLRWQGPFVRDYLLWTRPDPSQPTNIFYVDNTPYPEIPVVPPVE